MRQALTVLWEAADRVCGKRLKALIPMLVDAMERHGHLDLDPVVKTKVLQVSAATIDRVLADARLHIDGQRKRRNGVGSAIRRSIPVRTFADWRDPPPGFFEIDMVEHCGGAKTEGDYVHTLTLTDIASGWTECVAMRVRDQMLVIEAFGFPSICHFCSFILSAENESEPWCTGHSPGATAYIRDLALARSFGVLVLSIGTTLHLTPSICHHVRTHPASKWRGVISRRFLTS